jgi:hypothetical protein
MQQRSWLMNYTLNPLSVSSFKRHSASTLDILFLQSVEQQCTWVKANLKSERMMCLNCDHCRVNHNIAVFNRSLKSLYAEFCVYNTAHRFLPNFISTNVFYCNSYLNHTPSTQPWQTHITQTQIFCHFNGVCIYVIMDSNFDTNDWFRPHSKTAAWPDQYVHRCNSTFMWKWLMRREWNGHTEALITETLVSRTSDNWTQIHPITHAHLCFVCVYTCMHVFMHASECKREIF